MKMKKKEKKNKQSLLFTILTKVLNQESNLVLDLI